MKSMWLLLVGLVVLSGCLPGNEDDNRDRPPGTPSAPDLTTLTPGQVPSLDGELGCSFRETGRRSAGLFAQAWIDKASTPDAVVGLDGSPVRLTATASGGYGRLERQAGRFSGNGVQVSVTLEAAEPAAEPEPSTRAARLTIEADSGAARTKLGTWTCDPQAGASEPLR